MKSMKAKKTLEKAGEMFGNGKQWDHFFGHSLPLGFGSKVFPTWLTLFL